ncbi:MAG: glycosyltransferase family 25 protein [Pasteurellaceae bacterium]|nr:glycosyltransferase family 25 protein [Pasteurellaceae bacterium]
MKKYLISLDKDVKRRELFFSQPDVSDFEVFSAINTMNETELSLQGIFDVEKFHQRYKRKITKGEVGCTLSHLHIYQEIVDNETINDNDWVLICEDDALFAANFQHNLDLVIQQQIDSDIILIGQSKVPEFNDIELEINYPCTFACLQKKIPGTHYKYSYPYKDYFAGTVAYLIKKSATKKFISQLIGKKPFWLADDFSLFHQQFKINSVVIRPLLVIENQNLASNLQDLRGSLKNNMLRKLIKYPIKKVFAVLRNF